MARAVNWLLTNELGGVKVVMKVPSLPCFVMGSRCWKNLSQVWIPAALRECGEAK